MLATLDTTNLGSGNAAAIARIYLGLGELDAAIRRLDRAATHRDAFFSSESLASTLFDPLRARADFRAVLTRVNLDVAELY